MKHITILAFFIFSSLFSSFDGKAQTSQSKSTSAKIEIIDFYGTHRCTTCKAIEANTKYTLDTYFKEEQKNGILVFKTVNVDEDKNYKIAEAYEASGTALFLNIIKKAKETHVDLTDFAFSKGRDKEVFSRELKSKIEAALKE